MTISTYKAGELTVSSELPVIADINSLADKAILAVDLLSESLKTAENLNKIFYLTMPQDGYFSDTFYKLVVDTYNAATDTYTYKFIATFIANDDLNVDNLPTLMVLLENYPKF